jgi:hypothetical protein
MDNHPNDSSSSTANAQPVETKHEIREVRLKVKSRPLAASFYRLLLKGVCTESSTAKSDAFVLSAPHGLLIIRLVDNTSQRFSPVSRFMAVSPSVATRIYQNAKAEKMRLSGVDPVVDWFEFFCSDICGNEIGFVCRSPEWEALGFADFAAGL